MAFGNYADLKTNIATWLSRDDLTDRIPDFIALAEAWFNREFRTRSMEQRATTPTVAGQVYYGWPANLLEVRYIKVLSDPPMMLTYLPPEQIEVIPPQTATTPSAWSDIQSQLRIAPSPVAGLTIEIDYFKKIDLATDTNNWLLARYPDIYLYGALMQAEPYLMNDARVATWKSLLDAAVGQLTREDWRIKAGATPRTVRSEYAGA